MYPCLIWNSTVYIICNYIGCTESIWRNDKRVKRIRVLQRTGNEISSWNADLVFWGKGIEMCKRCPVWYPILHAFSRETLQVIVIKTGLFRPNSICFTLYIPSSTHTLTILYIILYTVRIYSYTNTCIFWSNTIFLPSVCVLDISTLHIWPTDYTWYWPLCYRCPNWFGYSLRILYNAGFCVLTNLMLLVAL